jgi:acyl-CoA dehydrogenase
MNYGAVFTILALILYSGFLPQILFKIFYAVAFLALGWWIHPFLAYILIGLYVVLILPPLRENILSRLIMNILRPFMPAISETERAALEAGAVWVEKDLFSGEPDLKKLIQDEAYPRMTSEEQAFLDNQVNELCGLIDHWEIYRTRNLSKRVWDYIKKEKFLGMIIPKEYGGLGFTALAHSEVIMKLSSRSMAPTISVMVPNSLGPAELLIHYGTEAQKKRYLPKLASGEEMPCFALTEPGAGSDAGSITSSGELFRGEDGKIYIRLNWNKRWITLASISTVLGLAFKLRDPHNLLGKGEDVGITCALIPTHTPGVVVGRRHDPLTIPFYNCPTQGKDVVVLAEEVIIGGLAMAGQGWQMLMECLAAGRGISLPAQITGGAKLATRITSAHSVIRQQFGVSIGLFEGVGEPLARLGSYTYQLEAMRIYTLGALDSGIKPPVVTAMMKYYSTETGRKLINDAMDIMGGAGISLGPRNLLFETYMGMPIGITVEGANIMTRCLIIFGQGALRAHPYAYSEAKAIAQNDLSSFDKAFWGHISHLGRNLTRSLALSLTRGHIASVRFVHPELRLYARRLIWSSASFAILADFAMGTLGGTLKFREKITGRFADILAHMFMMTATLRRFEADGRREEDLAFVKFALKNNLAEIQKAFDGLFDNMFGLKKKGFIPQLIFGSLHFVFKRILGSWSRINSIGSQATDHLQGVICEKIMKNLEIRERLTQGIFLPTKEGEQMYRLENTLKLVLESEAIEKKLHRARKEKILPRLKGVDLARAGLEKSVITQSEFQTLEKTLAARWDAIQVDDFSEEEYLSRA